MPEHQIPKFLRPQHRTSVKEKEADARSPDSKASLVLPTLYPKKKVIDMLDQRIVKLQERLTKSRTSLE